MIANPNDGNSPRVEVATPMIDVSAGGLITATTEQEKGYVPGGTKSATQQLTTQGAKTVTPGTSDQTAVASGRYTTGNVVVSGDANLVPENIAEGVSIFGVDGTHSGGGGVFRIISIGIYDIFQDEAAAGEFVSGYLDEKPGGYEITTVETSRDVPVGVSYDTPARYPQYTFVMPSEDVHVDIS